MTNYQNYIKGGQLVTRGIKYFYNILSGGDQLLWGTKYYVTGPGSVVTRLLRYPRAHRLVVFDGVYWQWLWVSTITHAGISYNVLTVLSAHRVCSLI